ncbi:MAG: hypothetical protein D6785_04875 [Planctomycetota bacterium]|nr:MAG: hypothetical protein D6785_04875 [Planctomycetota bacterium]
MKFFFYCSKTFPKRKTLLALGILILLGFQGCTSTYFYDRGQDFLDCWQFQFRVGRAEPNLIFYPVGVPSPGIKPYPFFIPFYGNIRLTKFFQMGTGSFHSKTYGMLGRGMGTWEESRAEWGLSILYYSKIKRKFLSGNDNLSRMLNEGAAKDEVGQTAEKLGDVDVFQPNDRSLFNIGAGFHLVTVGFDFGFEPLEFFDFFFGIFGIDFKKDDIATLRSEASDLLQGEEKEGMQEDFGTEARR